MSETLEILVVFAAVAVYAVMLIVPAVEYAMALSRLEKTIGGWWILDAFGRRVVVRIRCQAPAWDLYQENLRSRRRGNGF